MTTIRASLLCLVLCACGPTVQRGNGDGGSDTGEIDADPFNPTDPDARPWSVADGGIAYPDMEPYADGGLCDTWMCASPVADDCNVGGPDPCNGSDDNCNGQVDEGCTCTPGAVQECFLGPPGRRDVGACVDGHQTCTGSGEFTMWGDCTGGIRPDSEACDSVDSDCNGCVDDNPACCEVDLACPTSMPDGLPFQNYVIDGTDFYGGTVTAWQWEVHGGPCDVLFETTTGTPINQSFTLTGATTSTLTFHPTLSGDYTITVRMTLPGGTTYECTFIVHIGGPGLRIEMCSNRSGNTDLDLHVHKPGTTTNWFRLASGSTNTDDCFYSDCTATDTTIANWGYAASPLANCSGGPEGASWTSVGSCRNPRLDIDSIYDEGYPENTNIDNPVNGATYRVMVAYYGGTGNVNPLVNIYCGGYLISSYGVAPDLATLATSGGYAAGNMWRVVDVAPTVSGGMTTGCTTTALHPPGMTTGYWVTNNDISY